ncbi:MAG: hypothetical protein AB9836_12060 [Aminipila sp.]
MKILKILAIGVCTTVIRIICQLLIPVGEQNVLAPSSFVTNNTMQLAFTIYGIFAYSIIAMLFLIIGNKMPGKKIVQGLKYGFSCCAIWIIYLLEPLPHVALIDKFTYPIADSIALIMMGILCGLLLGKDNLQNNAKHIKIANMVPVLAITICFILGRFLQYIVFDSYSSFAKNELKTFIWCLLTGFTVSIVLLWFNQFVVNKSHFSRAITVGLLLFGVDLIFFNFFMPLVFEVDIHDLITRTAVDIVSVTIGCLLLPQSKNFKAVRL